MKHKVKITILSALGVWLVGSSVAYAYSQKGTLISQKTEELPDGNIYVEELYEIDQQDRKRGDGVLIRHPLYMARVVNSSKNKLNKLKVS